MIRLFRLRLPLALAIAGLTDLLMLALAAYIGASLRAAQLGLPITALAPKLITLLLFVGTNGVMLVAAGAWSPESLRSLGLAALRVQAGLSLAALALAVLAFASGPIGFSPMAVLYATLIGLPLVLAGRAGLRCSMGLDPWRQRVALLGTGKVADQVARVVAQRPGVILAGRVCTQHQGGLVDVVGRLHADELVLAVEERRNGLPLSDLVRLRTTGLRILDAASFIERETGRIDLGLTNPSWLILSDGFLSGRRLSALAKRMFDVAAALVLLLIVWPVLLAVMLLVRWDSPGPALFRQERVGRYGSPFTLLKFRSMQVDAEADGLARWAKQDDPRITRIGASLRKLRLDELPQLWNVLRGEMSFVGPRPERPAFVEALQAEIPYYAERHMVKPGITGWAQIHYPYGASTDDARAKLEYDLYYTKNYTFFLDVLILLQTVRVILWPDGAR